VLGLATIQGCRQPPKGSPPSTPRPWKKSEGGQTSILVGSFHWGCGCHCCGGCEGAAGPGHAKTFPCSRRKTVLGRILNCSCSDGEETSGSENETCLGAAGPPGWAAPGVAVAPGLGGLPRHQGLPGVASMAVHALRQLMAMISSRCPT
jgi:hypothetical protein